MRLGSIGETNIGLTYQPSDKTTSDGTLVLRASNIQNDKMDYNDNVYVSCNIPEKAMIHKGDILICARNGSRALVGKCAIVDKDGMAFGAFMAKFSSPFNQYIKLFIDSPIFRQQLEGVKTETINQITQDMLKNQLCPLPPANEQIRIVDMFYKLLPYIEKYEKSETELTALNTDFPEQLKKSILQQAVQGKLVPQDPEDEPASELLRRIKAEKQALVKAGKIKKDKQESAIITYDKIPYELPDNWAWCRLADVFYLQAGNNIAASEINEGFLDGLFPCYGGNGIRGYVKSFNRQGDYPIIGRQGALCGNINHAHGNFFATEHAICVETFAHTDVNWACLFLEALNLNQYATATAQPGIAVSKINNVLIPLPPLSEQRRIVSKIEELMKYCEML